MVSIKHKVTIKTKTAQEETPAAVEGSSVTLKRKQPKVPKEPTPIPPTADPGKSNTGKIVGGIAAAAAILAGVYFFGIKGDDKSGTDAGTPPTEQVAQAGETAQPEATTQTNVLEDGTTEEANAVSNSPEASSPTDNSETSVVGNDAPTTPKSEGKQSETPTSNAPSSSKPVQQTPSKQIDVTNDKIAAASAPIGGDVVENAKRVIRGDFGNGQERKDKLGSAYSEIQSKVNEMYRQGLVY